MRILLLTAALLLLPLAANAQTGEILFAITDNACRSAPNVQGGGTDCPSQTGRMTGSVEILMDDGLHLLAQYGMWNYRRICLVMDGPPAVNRCAPVGQPELRMREGNILSVGLEDWLEGKSLGDELAAALWAHYRSSLPPEDDTTRQQALIYDLVELPSKRIDGSEWRLASRVGFRFRLVFSPIASDDTP